MLNPCPNRKIQKNYFFRRQLDCTLSKWNSNTTHALNTSFNVSCIFFVNHHAHVGFSTAPQKSMFYPNLWQPSKIHDFWRAAEKTMEVWWLQTNISDTWNDVFISCVVLELHVDNAHSNWLRKNMFFTWFFGCDRDSASFYTVYVVKNEKHKFW